MTRRHLRAAALASLLLSGACTVIPPSESAPAPRTEQTAVDPAGVYDLRLDHRGQAVDGTLRLSRGEAGAWTGMVSTSALGDMPVRAVSVEGSRVRVTAQGRMGDAVLTLRMDGPAFSGDWNYGPAGGTLTGRRRAA